MRKTGKDSPAEFFQRLRENVPPPREFEHVSRTAGRFLVTVSIAKDHLFFCQQGSLPREFRETKGSWRKSGPICPPTGHSICCQGTTVEEAGLMPALCKAHRTQWNPLSRRKLRWIMNARKVAAQFAAHTWYENAREGRQTPTEIAKFVKKHWNQFLPLADEGLGKLLIRIAARRSQERRQQWADRPSLVAAV
jgi:hypothetical protein